MRTNEMTVFRPCPFCGSTRLAIASDTIPLYAVQCGDCSACGPCAATPDEATSEWNTPGILERTLNSATKIILDRSNRWREVAEFYADPGSECHSCPLCHSGMCSDYEHEASCREKLFRWAEF